MLKALSGAKEPTHYLQRSWSSQCRGPHITVWGERSSEAFATLQSKGK